MSNISKCHKFLKNKCLTTHLPDNAFTNKSPKCQNV